MRCPWPSARATGEIAEAHRGFGEIAEELGASGEMCYGSFAADYAAECFLVEGDATGYQRFVSDQEETVRPAQLWNKVLDGFNLLIERRLPDSEARFREGVAFAEGQPASATLSKLDLGLAHFYHAAALRAWGKEREAAEERTRALDTWRAYKNQGFLSTSADRENRLVDGLKKILGER